MINFIIGFIVVWAYFMIGQIVLIKTGILYELCRKFVSNLFIVEKGMNEKAIIYYTKCFLYGLIWGFYMILVIMIWPVLAIGFYTMETIKKSFKKETI